MLQQFFIENEENDLYVMSWLNENPKGVIVICPPVVKRGISGIRYYVSQLAMKYYDRGFSVFAVNYDGLANSGVSYSFTYNKMLDSIRKLLTYIEDNYANKVEYIVGIGAGNYGALELGIECHIEHVTLMNPDFNAVDGMQNLLKQGIRMQACTLVDGYLETQYYRMTSNGSDATFTIMNLEEPDTELRFWTAMCGPFFGGEEEVIPYQFVCDLTGMKMMDKLKQHSDVTIISWGKEQLEEGYYAAKKVEYVGKFTNEDYWFKSSILWDDTIDKAVSLVEESTDCVVRANLKFRNISVHGCAKRECVSVDIRGEQCLGILHSPVKPSDKKFPLIIFEHGLGCDSVGEYGSWVRLTEKLSQIGFYCYRYDHLGSGVSGGKFEDSLYTGYTDDLKQNLNALMQREELEDRKVVILSWSFGAYISLLTSEELKDKIAGYVFWSPLLVEGTATSKVKFFRSESGGYRFPISPLWLNVNYLKEERQYDFVKMYEKVEKPLLLVTGEMDNPEFSEAIARDIVSKNTPEMKHVKVYNTGHCFSEETINYVINSTIGWLDSLFGEE